MPTRRPLTLEDRGLLVKLSSRKQFRVPFEIWHVAEKSYRGFAEIEGMIDDAPLLHTLTLRIDESLLEMAWRGRDRYAGEAEVEVEWEELAQFATPTIQEQFNGRELPIAKLWVEEFPTWMRYELRYSWHTWFDAMDSEGAWLGAALDEIERQVDAGNFAGDFVLAGGAVLLIRNVCVHPAFQGQELGAKLLAHTMWALHRDLGDVAILLAYPCENYFTGERPSRSRQSVARLASYYARVGFRRIGVEGPEEFGDGVPMWTHFGEGGLPVKGAGWMGIQKRRRRPA